MRQPNERCGADDIHQYLHLAWEGFLNETPERQKTIDRERLVPTRETIRLYGRALKGEFRDE